MNGQYSHDNALANLQKLPLPQSRARTRSEKTITAKPVPVLTLELNAQWSMDSFEPCPFPPPWPSEDKIRAMEAEAKVTNPEGPLGDLAKQWTIDLCAWHDRLQEHFQFDPTDLASNVRRSAEKWERRLQHLKLSDNSHFRYIMRNIKEGHRIP